MRILIDVDGVMLNTQEALLKRLNKKYGTRYTLENVTNYHWFENVYKNINPWAELEDKAFWQEEVSLINGAKEAFWDLYDNGYAIYFVTASNPFNPAFSEKLFRLSTLLNLPLDRLCKHTVITQYKELIVGNVLIDDCASNVYNWKDASHFRVIGLLFSQPWNKNNEYNLHPHNSWKEIVNIIKNLDQ